MEILLEKLLENLSKLSLHILNSYQVSSLTRFQNSVRRPENSREDTSGGSKPVHEEKEICTTKC